MRSVDSFLGTTTNTPIGKYKISETFADDATSIGEGLPIGTLVAITDKGALISAESNLVAGTLPLVVGVITEGSVVTIDDPRYIENGKKVKNAGDFQEVYRQFKLLNVTDCQIGATADTFKWAKKDIGTAVYGVEAEVDGVNVMKLTTHFDGIQVGKKYQRLGYLGDSARKEIIMILDQEVKTKA